MVAQNDFNLWSVLKNCIGKELSNITMPVVFNEPLSFLQRMTEYMEYAKLLRLASEQEDPIERMKYVAGKINIMLFNCFYQCDCTLCSNVYSFDSQLTMYNIFKRIHPKSERSESQ